MAANKPHRPALAANGEPVVDQARREPRPARKTKAQLESRIAVLEKDVARLTAELEEVRGPQQPWWQKISGSFADDPAFEEAMRLGREWRESFRPKKKTRLKKSAHGRS
jgi:hypothetical protein